MNGQLERELSEGLHALAAHAPARPGWEGIQHRVARRRRARRLQRMVVAVALIGVCAGGLAAVATRDRGGHVAAGPPGEPLRYVADAPGYRAMYASEASTVPPPGVAGEAGTLHVLARPGAGFSGPLLFVRVVPAGAAYGIGDVSPAAETVDVNGQTGFLLPQSSIAIGLGWRRPDGSAVHLVSVRLSPPELLAAARALAVGAQALTWAPGSMPAGLELLRATKPGRSSTFSAESDYAGAQGKGFVVRVKTGDEYIVDSFIADRAGAARALAQVDVGGVPAVLSTYDRGDRQSLIWAVRPGLMVEVDAVGLTDAEVVAVARSIRPASDDEWAVLLGRVSPGPSPASTANDRAIAEVGQARCEVRTEWLAANARGDRGTQDAAAGKLADLLAGQRAQGVEPNGDIFLVVDRLVQAMRKGDVAAVQAQACN